MKRIYILLSLGLVSLFFSTACGTDKKSDSGVAPVSSHQAGNLHWSSDWDGALQKAEAENKLVIVDFYADWCVWCKKLDKTTLSDKAVMAYLGEHFVPVRLDVDHKGRELSRKFRIDGLPTLLIVNPEGMEVGRIPGFLPPDAFLEQIRSILGS